MGRKTYTEEYPGQIVALARAGRSFSSLAREFEPSIQTIRKWVKQADGKDRSADGIWAKKYRHLERENARLKEERDILAQSMAWFAQETKPTVKRSTGS
ncbi:MAG: transposase [Gammaproteobacteria bacterium]|nr:transposase [Gammaproteobacteria bacterium]